MPLIDGVTFRCPALDLTHEIIRKRVIAATPAGIGAKQRERAKPLDARGTKGICPASGETKQQAPAIGLILGRIFGSGGNFNIIV